jgi:hypothetical protein
LLILVLLRTQKNPWFLEFLKEIELKRTNQGFGFSNIFIRKKNLQIKCHIVFPSILSVFVDSILKGET